MNSAVYFRDQSAAYQNAENILIARCRTDFKAQCVRFSARRRRKHAADKITIGPSLYVNIKGHHLQMKTLVLVALSWEEIQISEMLHSGPLIWLFYIWYILLHHPKQ